MKSIFTSLFKVSIVFFFLALSDSNVKAQQQMAMPSFTGQYNLYARGFWFVAPVDFKIVGLRVGNGAYSATQAFQVVRMHEAFPIAFGNQSSNFEQLLYTNGVPAGQIYAANITINAGDTIGILGGTNYSSSGTGTSYGNGPFTSSIFGNNVSIQRFGHQDEINSAAAGEVWGVAYQGAGQVGRVEVYYTTAVIEDYPYCEDFDNGAGGWSAGGILPTWELGEPNNTFINAANSPDDCWVTDLDGDHNNDELSYVQSPIFNLESLQDPSISVYTIRDLESGDDGVAVQVSVDSGNNWTTLGSSSSSAPWYNSSSISALNSQGNGNGWTGTNSGWELMQHSLSTYTNDTTVWLRFLMAADGNTVDEGFGFDDILVAESNDIKMVDLSYPDSACGSSLTQVSAEICNNSIEDKYGFTVALDTNGTSITQTYSDTLFTCMCDTVNFTINTSNGGTWALDAYVSNNGDVNTSNDSISGSMTTFSIPSVQVAGGGEYCDGDVATLTFTFQGLAPWNLSYTDGTNGYYNANLTSNPYTVNVTSSGTYEPVNVTDSSGCPADTSLLTGVAEVIFYPSPSVDLGPDSSVCGDYVLDAGAGYVSYAWSNSATTQMVTADQSSTYAVTVTDTAGCTASDEVDLEIFPLPQIPITDTVLCEGASHLFNAGAPYASYLWHDGSTGQLFQIDSVGTVSVTVTDFNGCEGTATASITAVVSNPTPSVSSIPGLAPVTLDAGSGYIAYFWNTNDTTQTISVSVSGTYTVTVTDLNGCMGSGETKTKIWPVGVEDIAAQQGFAVHPNPAKDRVQVTIDPDRGFTSYRLLSIDGKLVAEGNTPEQTDRFVLSIPAGTASGSYILEMSAANETLRQRLEIAR